MIRKLIFTGIVCLLISEFGYGGNNSPHVNQLKILSWNIKLLPPPYGWFLNSDKRTENIADFLLSIEGFDVILFQEGFSKTLRSQIYGKLQSIYPYQIEPHDQTVFFKTNSGLWAISKIPLKLIDEISFSLLKGWDWMSSKGAKLYTVEKGGQQIFLINTHLQADYETQFPWIRKNQYEEINQKLIIPNISDDTPLIFCGDLNISQPSHLSQLLNQLNLKNGPLLGKIQFSTLGQPRQLLDYILVKRGSFQFEKIQRKILGFTLKEKGEKNLSDHFPVQATFKW